MYEQKEEDGAQKTPSKGKGEKKEIGRLEGATGEGEEVLVF